VPAGTRRASARAAFLRTTKPFAMRFDIHEIASLPLLAWCARVDPGSETVVVAHGAGVETRGDAFVEGAWNGAFAAMDLAGATSVCGTGGVARSDRVRFVASADQLGPIFSVRRTDSVCVSNSPSFVMTAAGVRPDDLYPFYPYDLLHIFRCGLHCPAGEVRLADGARLCIHYATIVSVDVRGRRRCEAHPLADAPRDFAAYRALLATAVREIVANAGAVARKRRYTPLVSLSRGYDSTACAVLTVEAGGTDAFTYVDARADDPHRDDGTATAQRLGLRCSAHGRWDYLGRASTPVHEFGYGPTSSSLPLTAAADRLPNRLLVLGEIGDSIWDPRHACVFDGLSRSWIRFTLGLSAIEFRLRVGYLVFAPPSIGARHNRAVHAISTSDAMRAWSIGSRYDRPVPRRIAEEAGLPRGSFGVRKRASSHCHLNEASGFTVPSFADYRAFVDARHAVAPSRVRDAWRARHARRHRLWDWVPGNRRDAPMNLLHRQVPFVLDTTPIRVPWECAFTFQWTAAAMQPRYRGAFDGLSTYR